MRLGLICLAWCLGCAPTFAGPWPREVGTSFLSFSLEGPTSGDSRELYYSTYFEVGQTEWLTLGFDGGTDYYTNGEGFGFARAAFPEIADSPHRFAVLAGVGARYLPGFTSETLYVLGASWGMGFENAFGPGWASVDATLRDRSDSGTRLLKIDGTLGFNRSSRQLWLAQLRYADDDLADEASLELAPSIAWPLSPRARLETGAAFGLRGAEDVKLKLGIWAEF